MKYSMVLGLAGLASTVTAHPKRSAQPDHEGASTLSKRGVDISKFPLPSLSEYTQTSAVEDGESSFSISSSDYVQVATDLVKATLPDVEFRLVDDHYIGTNGVAHVNFKQTAHGIDIDNADFNVNIKDGKVFSHGSSFFTGKIPEENPQTKREYSDPVDALKGAVEVLELPIEVPSSAVAEVENSLTEESEQYTIRGTSGAVSNPQARLVYFSQGDSLKLAWRVETDVTDNWLLSYVDANTNTEIHGVVDYVSDLATYEVYPWGINDPTEGDRKVIADPWLSSASEFTWHGDGRTTYNTTRGNNAVAQVNPQNLATWENNYRPISSNLSFNYPFSLAETDPTKYWDASVAQLFYTSNKFHDLAYVLGFTEAAGNFETNNNGQGGIGNDFAILNAQDGSGFDNANFASPPDGQNGRMRMYLWTASTPRRDCSFEAGVVIHEFTHGLSNRLTGGPANAACLPSGEAGGMGEGWSDFFATAIRLKAGDTAATNYPMGAWVSSRPNGIRAYPYSTSLTTNPLTYRSIDAVSGVHAIGTIWCSILYEVLWNLINTHGKNDADLPNFVDGIPDDGKYLALKLVQDGMALQPCNPNFITARNAIIDADVALTGGANACDLWTGFAKRGLGENAANSGGRRESFDVPAGVC